MSEQVERGRSAGASGGRRDGGALRGKLRARDPFDLIRWLALSQPDPRKALAELVQNSLDAGARKIRVTRIREHRVGCLKILDDGEGVIPEMDRPEALRYIATNIGDSRKRALSLHERHQLMMQGQYGIGLLGFWSLGEALEMRTAVPGQRPHRLVLHRDRADFVIEPLRGRLPIDERWTEVVVVGLHRDALPVLVGRRAAEYLASELRGQLLARQVDLVVEDRMSRGRAPKRVPVRPPRFLGERLDGIGPVEVPGHPPIRLEVYFTGDAGGEEGATGLGLYSAGTVVADGFDQLAALELDRAPWTDARLSGMVDFAGFRVAPGSRRGVVVDEAAGAFARALRTVEPILEGLLQAIERRREQELDRNMIRDLQRAFRDFYRQRPRYAMLPVRAEGEGGAGTAAAGEPAEPGPAEEVDDVEAGTQPPVELLPAGPLAAVRLRPARLRAQCATARTVRATAVDAAGRPIEGPVDYAWRLEGPIGTLRPAEGAPDRVILAAAEAPGAGLIEVMARAGGSVASAAAEVEVVEELPASRGDEGIPEPVLVDNPGAAWRSRMVDGRWEVNSGHREYRSLADRPALKLRYLAMLFAKEIVLRSSQDPRLERPLEQLVEVAAYADRNLSTRGPRRRK
jgi:hypothetical protein